MTGNSKAYRKGDRLRFLLIGIADLVLLALVAPVLVGVMTGAVSAILFGGLLAGLLAAASLFISYVFATVRIDGSELVYRHLPWVTRVDLSKIRRVAKLKRFLWSWTPHYVFTTESGSIASIPVADTSIQSILDGMISVRTKRANQPVEATATVAPRRQPRLT